MNLEYWKTVLENPGRMQTIALDWLELFLCPADTSIGPDPERPGFIIPDPLPEVRSYPITESVNLILEPYGSPMFSYRWKVILHGEEFAILQTHPRREIGGLKKDRMNLKVLNHQLYTADMLPGLMEVLEGINATVHNVSRLDIAIDGANEVRDFLNAYTKQNREDKAAHLKGKANFSGLMQDHNTMEYDRFILGSSLSGKQISVYCKSLEIERSNKKYIENFWRSSGMEADGPVYRCELRLKSEGIKALQNFEIEEIDNPAYQASIFQTHSENYFQFTRFSNDSNISRQDDFRPLRFDKFGAVLLPRAKKAQTTDRYKVKLSVHRTVKHTLTDHITDYQKMLLISNISYDLNKWDLWDWYEKKLPTWEETYTAKGTRVKSPKYLDELKKVLWHRPATSEEQEEKAMERRRILHPDTPAEGTEELNKWLDNEIKKVDPLLRPDEEPTPF